jgi:hypothetical protein
MAIDRVSSRANLTISSPLKHFTGLWCLVVAVLPIVVSQFELIPIYESQRRLLPAFASFFSLLTLAFVFSQRHRMARALFSPRLLWADTDAAHSEPRTALSIHAALAGTIAGALVCAAMYLWAFEIGRGSPAFPRLPPSSLNAVLLALSFITLFVLASASCAIVAVREHVQGVLGLSDAEVITGQPRSMSAMATAAPSHQTRINVVAERTPSRLSAMAEEPFNSEELFTREPGPPRR